MKSLKRSSYVAVAAVAFACGNIFMATTMTSCSNKGGVAADSDSIVAVDSDSIAACVTDSCALTCDSAAQLETPASASTSVIDTKANTTAAQADITGKDLDFDLGYATYHGDLKNGKPDGQGKLYFKRSHVIPNLKQYTAAKGDVVEGVFRDGEVVTATWKKAAGGSQTISK